MTMVRRASSCLAIGVRLWALSMALALGACSSLHDLSGAPHAGYQSDGTYILTAQEQGLGCRQLEERSLGLMEQMKALPARAVAEMQKLPGTVTAAWGRMFGAPGDGVAAIGEYDQARAESEALNAALAKKGCRPVDLAAAKR